MPMSVDHHQGIRGRPIGRPDFGSLTLVQGGITQTKDSVQQEGEIIYIRRPDPPSTLEFFSISNSFNSTLQPTNKKPSFAFSSTTFHNHQNAVHQRLHPPGCCHDRLCPPLRGRPRQQHRQLQRRVPERLLQRPPQLRGPGRRQDLQHRGLLLRDHSPPGKCEQNELPPLNPPYRLTHPPLQGGLVNVNALNCVKVL